MDKQTDHAVRKFLRLIADRYPLRSAMLYGSRARGTHRPDSDADIALVLDGPHPTGMETAWALADAAFDVLLDTGINISPLPIWRDEWEHPEYASNPSLLRNIAREGIPL